MPLVFAPRHFQQRAEFYHQLAQLTAAGVPLLKALDQLQRHPPARAWQPPIQRLLQRLNTGSSVAEALAAEPTWWPAFDHALLDAGERSGRLDQTFNLLADYYRRRATMVREFLSQLAYPALLLHLAVFILPFAQFFLSGDWLAYLRQTFGVLLPLYLFVALLVYLNQSRHGVRWRRGVETVLRPVPVLGAARRDLALSRLAAALEALLASGVTVHEAWALAAHASASPGLCRLVHSWKPRLAAGSTPGELLRQSAWFPETFANLYQTGEISGKLEESLRQLQRIYQEQSARRFEELARWVPRAIYLLLVLWIATRIVQFWTGYFQQVQNAVAF
ncbi:MAG: type II secretion system F family protein [Verrucomicrobiae bacterium]|nr:type II secretion system F family protein [Verrucomicrobiae bacterium]